MTTLRNRVLIVDDEHDVLTGLAALLEDEWEVRTADTGRAAIVTFAEFSPDVVLLDVNLPDTTGIELLHQLKMYSEAAAVIMMSGAGTHDVVIESMKLGAETFLQKPFDYGTLTATLEQVRRIIATRREIVALRRAEANVERLPGVSRPIAHLNDILGNIARAPSVVLLEGESGTGKGVMARLIHNRSPRARAPFVDLNCAGLSKELLESELFGHERGAFTNATNTKPGLFEIAGEGTLFLDEIGEMELTVQARLLKSLEEKRFRRVGGIRDLRADFRLIAATNRDLTAEVTAGRFRGDLYYRLNVVRLRMPPLRERMEDLPILVQEILRPLAKDMGRPLPKITPNALKKLESYPWPGNVRELRNVLERAMITLPGEEIRSEDLSIESHAAALPKPATSGMPSEEWEVRPLEEMVATYVAASVKAVGGNVRKAARLLQISPSTLYARLKHRLPTANRSRYHPRGMPRYLLSWSTPVDRLFDITIRFTAPADTPRLLLPAWRPGRYLLQNYAANVREWTAGEARAWKDGKTSWRVDARAGEEVTFRYRYFAGVLDAGSSFLDDDEAYFNGTNLFMLVDGLRGEEHLLTIAAPSEWLIETQLPREDGTFRARDYDHLIDSTTIAAATLTRHSFSESGARFHLVFRGDEGIDTEAYVEPLRAIAKTQARLFGGGFPFREYRFLYHVRDRWHGVEHEDSCSIIVRRSAILGSRLGDEGFDHVLSISSHELFHAWNVKRMLPAAFLPYDYWQETPTRLLWAMEGLTSYYGDLSLVRSGLWSVERYLVHLAREIETLESLPARAHLSLAQASFDGWLSDPAQMHDHPNAFFSFYNKGELVSALLDLTIRRATHGTKSLDDVLRLLWEEYGLTGRGMEEDAVERAVARVADVGDFFARYVDGTDPLPYAELFAEVGVAFATATRQPEQAFLGAKLKMQDGLLIVESAMRGAAGMEAGLLPNDELLALDGNRIANLASLESAMRALKLGESAELLVARAGVVKSLSLTGRPDPRPLVILKTAGASELRREWLWRDE